MLAQSFQSAADLGITEPQRAALAKVLVMLETGKLTHVTKYKYDGRTSDEFTGHFNMKAWGSKTDCGTIHCIGGTAEAVGNVRFGYWEGNERLYRLFAPRHLTIRWNDITPTQAARALRSYLTTGDAKWDEAVA